MSASSWFEVDRDGLAKILARKGLEFVVFELIQNGWDTGASRVDVTLTALAGTPMAELVVTDDDPDGFRNISHAFTLFAESEKKADPTKRGRFNLGEKLVLALCREASIVSTRAAVLFDDVGRHDLRRRRESGTEFRATVRMTHAQVDDVIAACRQLIPPVPTTVNGEPLASRESLTSFSAKLSTEMGDTTGALQRTKRITMVRVYPAGQQAWLYEMGIPVCEVDLPWTVEVMQKVPLTLDREGVMPSFLRDLGVEVVNAMRESLDEQAVAAPAVQAALADKRISSEAVKAIVRERYGEKVMVRDPNDEEANARAQAAGFAVIPGRAFSKEQWVQIRAADAVPPTTRDFATGVQPAGDRLPEEKVTEAMRRIRAFSIAVAREVIQREIEVRFTMAPTATYAACYGSRRLTFNVGRLGYSWFEGGPRDVAVMDLLIHELAHEMESNHLSDGYYGALSLIGGRLARLAIDKPQTWTDGAP